ncbi:hypothetical protein I7I50_07564 [Histoplasma capsulatum G186AR]|uniref:Uncharacterized protein n=1 Tax=Ajellomyces capsulatus TaxID=5037 RepID=A0A8H7YZD7_AJECA|nr:hypothetical protein I7I52_09364 [Histoplasma capsulatum]QSS68227.1 hypothetical protein I7I50_07564 [Histoplasma capsulatum G186AR]
MIRNHNVTTDKASGKIKTLSINCFVVFLYFCRSGRVMTQIIFVLRRSETMTMYRRLEFGNPELRCSPPHQKS